jgi:membrane-associated protease RseP (regulator of RpoE activity)
MTSLLLAALLFWIVTAVHEGGHAVAVRLKGGAVEVFQVGRGPAFAASLPGGTRLALGVLPFGGRLRYRGIPPGTGEAVVAVAGPLANLLVAALLLPDPAAVARWLWLVPGSVVDLLGDGRAPELHQARVAIQAAITTGTIRTLGLALGSLSAVWAALNLIPIPGMGTDGWVILRGLGRALRPGGRR